MKLVIFDFDGVLANTEELCYQIHIRTNKNLTWKQFQEFSLGNFFDVYEQSIKDGTHLPIKDFHSSYKKALDTITIHDILHDSIVALAKEYRLVIISSSTSSYIKDFLTREGVSKYFSDILGADVHKNKTLKINSILEKYELVARDTIFITDTLGDIKEANKCDVRSIAVTWGLHDKEILEKGYPLKIISDPRDLVRTIKEI